MAYTFEELRHKNVAELREIAGGLEHDAVQGYTQMHKDQLLAGVCVALGIDPREHHHAVGVDTRSIKGEIRNLKAARASAIEAKDRSELKKIRRRIHRLKHQLRRATV